MTLGEKRFETVTRMTTSFIDIQIDTEMPLDQSFTQSESHAGERIKKSKGPFHFPHSIQYYHFRSILTDPEIHQKLHDSHYDLQSRYYGYWYGTDLYAYDSQVHFEFRQIRMEREKFKISMGFFRLKRQKQMV